MANNCFVDIDITVASPEEAGKLFKILTEAKWAADREERGIYIGSERRYLFETEIAQSGSVVSICGWVKWGFDDIEVWQFLAWLMARAGVRDFRMKYDECGALLYGEYHYDLKNLTDRYLPQDYYPAEEDGDVKKAFQQYGVTRFLG